MSSFSIALNAVLPFIIYLSVGALLAKVKLVDDAFLKKLNKFVFVMCFPVQLFFNLYNLGEGQGISLRFVAVALTSIFIVIGVSYILVPKFEKTVNRRGVIIQALFRANYLMFLLPMVDNLFGQEGMAAASVASAVVIPTYNVCAVIVLESFRGEKVNAKKIAKGVATNPLIIGAALGFLFFLLKIKLPGFINEPLIAYKNMCTPLGMIALGGSTHISSMKKNAKTIAATLFVRSVILPAIALAACMLIGMHGIELFLVVAMYAMPVASNSFVMAQTMGGDGDLAGEILVVSTILAVFVLFFWVYIMASLGVFA